MIKRPLHPSCQSMEATADETDGGISRMSLERKLAGLALSAQRRIAALKLFGTRGACRIDIRFLKRMYPLLHHRSA